MRLGWGAWNASLIAACCLLLTLPALRAQNSSASNSADAARDLLVQKAHALEARGRPDMAIQLWQQILLSAPQNTEALTGLARDYKLTGATELANQTLDRLRNVNPNDPSIAKIEALSRTATQTPQLRQAGAAELGENPKPYPQESNPVKPPRQNESKPTESSLAAVRTPAERAAFGALNAQHFDDAEQRFTALLAQDPNNARALAGMGILRMQQKKFSDAVDYLAKAEQRGYKTKVVDDALSASRFSDTLAQATQAMDQDQLDVAAAKFRAALDLNPLSVDALNGLAGLYLKQKQYIIAASTYDKIIRLQPKSLDGWRGLFLAHANAGQNDAALDVSERTPAPVRAALNHDPDYLRTLAGIYQAQGRIADAEHTLAQAVELPSSGNASTLQSDTRMQYAGILMKGKRFEQAAALYSQVVLSDSNNLSAWLGLISAHFQLGQNEQALSDVQRMPPAMYESALGDADFLGELAAIYQHANQYDVAQSMLERAFKLDAASGKQPGTDQQLQLAGIYLLRNNTSQASDIYGQVLTSHPENASAWKGLISALAAANRNADALQELAEMPAAVRTKLDSEIAFVQIEASLYSASGDIARALQYMNRVQAHYAKLKALPPPEIDIQNAWLLYNLGDNRALYASLMRLGGRTDLSLTQRETIQNVWANWSVRRAAAAMDNGNAQHAVDILDAATLAFPNNLTVRKAVAGGYARVGRAKEALALYKVIPMQDATAGDFEGAIGAALGADDKNQAEVWLRQALARYPRDPAVLTLAAHYEQARGNNLRAADYYRASIAAMPAVSPADRLAHELVYPEQDRKTHRAVTAADLQRLLDPDYEPFAKTTRLPPLPAYGPDPYDGGVPATLPQQSPVPELPPVSNPVPASHDLPPPLIPHAALDKNPSPHSASQPAHLVLASFAFSRPRFITRSDFLRNASAESAILQAAAQPYSEEEIVLNPPHSLASDTWKGLVFSLMAGNRDAEALAQLSRIPPEVRRQLEADIEWAQGLASLYYSVGDTPEASYYLKRVENFYLLHPGIEPASVELQHAWLLYSINNDAALYPALTRVDARTDLTPEQRQQVQTLWANWAIRRANEYIAGGQVSRAAQILRAALQDYPDNLTVRFAVAGAYMRIARAPEALAVYKSTSMANAGSPDYQGAIGAALGAGDMAQAEIWLRVALNRFPNDPQILGLAARFEQARGNNQRAMEFWRAALAATPQGSSATSIATGISSGFGADSAPAPGETKRLLDPRLNPHVTPEELAPLPSYKSQPPAQSASALPNLSPAEIPAQISAPSAIPLPLPSSPANPTFQPAGQGSNAPYNVPSGTNPNFTPTGPVFVEQNNSQQAVIAPAGGNQPAGDLPAPSQFSERASLLPSEANINSTGGSTPQTAGLVHPALSDQTSAPPTNPLIATPPTNAAAAQTQARLANRSSNPFPESSALQIQNVPTAPVAQPQPTPSASQGAYDMAQYAPSAQDAATGAFSAPQQQLPVAPPPTATQPAACVPASPPACAPAKPRPTPSTTVHKKLPAKSNTQAAEPPAQPLTEPPAQTLGNAPIATTPPSVTAPATPPQGTEAQQPVEAPAQNPPETTVGTGLTDEELAQRNLPPLRGPWIRMRRQANPVSPREEAEQQLAAIESGYSGWIGFTSLVNHRSGAPGYSQLTAIEPPFEASAPLGYHARITAIAKPVFLDSGQADGTANLAVQESQSGSTCLVTIPEPIGTYIASQNSSPCSSPTIGVLKPPAQQNAVGVGGELQLTFPHLAIAGGYTPSNFLAATFTARFQWQPANGPFTVSLVRDSVKDSQLSYSGLRDPGQASLTNPGQIWGGVIANQGLIQFSRGNAQSGYYFAAGGQYITGVNVEKNNRIDGTGGAYWRAFTSPENGDLTIGANFFGMHYANNQNAFTHGMGGYFSPQAYFLGNIPVSWVGHYQTQWHYNIVGAVGAQVFQQDSTPLWPLAVDKPLETSQNNPMLPAVTSVSANYDFRSEVAYQISPHLYAGAYLAANNNRNYSYASAGFFLRFMFRAQPSAATAPTGLFPADGIRPFTVP